MDDAFTLTVDPDGELRLWANRGEAVEKKKLTEVVVRLPLTIKQFELLGRGQRLAVAQQRRFGRAAEVPNETQTLETQS
jgi:hypothetical protein